MKHILSIFFLSFTMLSFSWAEEDLSSFYYRSSEVNEYNSENPFILFSFDYYLKNSQNSIFHSDVLMTHGEQISFYQPKQIKTYLVVQSEKNPLQDQYGFYGDIQGKFIDEGVAINMNIYKNHINPFLSFYVRKFSLSVFSSSNSNTITFNNGDRIIYLVKKCLNLTACSIAPE